MLRLLKALLKALIRPSIRKLSAAIDPDMHRIARAVVHAETWEKDAHIRKYLEFLAYEASIARRMVRCLIADLPAYQAMIEQTSRSFDSQWASLPESKYLLTNKDFRDSINSLLCTYTGLEPEWFAGKRVLDVGCGSGRWSWGMAKLGASVTALDQSGSAVSTLQTEARNSGLAITVLQHNVLEPLPLPERSFDFVWSYGVLHHTGNTFKGFQNIWPMVKENGYLFLMLYGEPRLNCPGDFQELAEYERLRRQTRNKSFKEILDILENDAAVTDVHGWFDAVSPFVNDIYSFDEIEDWLLRAGFGEVRRTVEHRNHHVIARKQALATAQARAA